MRCGLFLCGVLAALVSFAGTPQAAPKDTIRIGYIEGGEYYQHVLIRNVFMKSLRYMLADQHEVQFATSAIRSGGWKRDSCRAAARSLARNNSLDLILALGPWVVEELVQAGCKIPIVAAYQPFPSPQPQTSVSTILALDSRQKIEQDMELIQRLANPKRIGVLGFTDSGNGSPLVEAVRKSRAGSAWEVVSADGYDNYSTFAFFKAFSQLPKGIDALYIGPLWRLDVSSIDDFLAAAAQAHIKVFSFDPTLVEHGALGSTAYGWPPAIALFHAGQAAQQLKGQRIAQIPMAMQPSSNSILNQATARLCGAKIPEALQVTELVVGTIKEPATASLGLGEAIHRSIEGSPGMVMAQARADAALTEYARYSEFTPNVQLYGEIARIDDHTVDAHSGVLSRSLAGAGISLDQTIFSWSALQQLKAGKDLKLAGEQATESVRQLLSLAVIESYANLLEAREYLSNLHDYRMRIDEFIQLALAREAVGLAEPDEYRRWDARRWEAIAQQASGENQLMAARYGLNSLLNQPLSEPIEPDSQLFTAELILRETVDMVGGFRSPNSQSEVAEKLLVFAREWEPELQESNRRLSHQERWMNGSSARWTPRIGFRAELGLSDSLAAAYSSIKESPRWKVGLNFSLPLFGPKSGSAARRSASFETDHLSAKRDSLDLALQREVYDQVQQLVTASTRTIALFESVKQLRSAIPELATQYAAGRVPMGDCERELSGLHSSQVARSQSHYLYFVTEARLLKAVGSPLSQLHGALGSTLQELLQD